MIPAAQCRFQESSAEGNEDKQAQIPQRDFRGGSKPRPSTASSWPPHQRLAPRLIDLIEHSVMTEVLLLGIRPPSNDFIDSEQFDLRKLSRILVGNRFNTRTVEPLRADFP